ncbi:AAA family ATPase [Homoserinimonas sp. A520]
MSRLLLISRSRKFESRLRSLLDYDFQTIMGTSLAKGSSAVLANLNADDRPDIALLGPSLSHAQTYELSAGLSELYPRAGIMLVMERGRAMDKWVSDMRVDAVASPSLDDAALLKAVEKLGRRHDPPRRRTRQVPVVRASEPEVVPVEPAPEPEMVRDVEPEPEVVLEPLPELEERGEADVEEVLVADAFPSEPLPSAEPPVAEPAKPEHATARHASESLAWSGRVISVVSPKGGMGKTTVATNLAVGLAGFAPNSVVLIDGDVQFGDVATALALQPTYTLPDAVSEAAAGDTMVLKTYLTAHDANFYTVCGAASPIDGDRVTGDQLGALIAQLRDEFRYVVVDTTPGLGEHTLAAIEQSTDLVFVCGMSVTSARGLRTHLAAMESIGLTPPSRHVVLNFADRDSGMSIRDVESTTGVPVDIAIPRSKLVVLSTNMGHPVLEDRAKNPTSKAFAALVQRFDPAAGKQRSWRHRRVVLK